MLFLKLVFLFDSVREGLVKSFHYSHTHHPYLLPTQLFLWQHDLSTENPFTAIVLTCVLTLKTSKRR